MEGVRRGRVGDDKMSDEFAVKTISELCVSAPVAPATRLSVVRCSFGDECEGEVGRSAQVVPRRVDSVSSLIDAILFSFNEYSKSAGKYGR